MMFLKPTKERESKPQPEPLSKIYKTYQEAKTTSEARALFFLSVTAAESLAKALLRHYYLLAELARELQRGQYILILLTSLDCLFTAMSLYGHKVWPTISFYCTLAIKHID